jgi:hypothetical protein
VGAAGGGGRPRRGAGVCGRGRGDGGGAPRGEEQAQEIDAQVAALDGVELEVGARGRGGVHQEGDAQARPEAGVFAAAGHVEDLGRAQGEHGAAVVDQEAVAAVRVAGGDGVAGELAQLRAVGRAFGGDADEVRVGEVFDHPGHGRARLTPPGSPWT